MYEAVGFETGKHYMTGASKAECLRKLNEKFPSIIMTDTRFKHGVENNQIYPEPLQIRRKIDEYFTEE